MPASAATGWCSSSPTATPRAPPRWAARAPTGSARRRSRRASMCSRISATAPIIIRACWRIRAAIASGVNITYKILFNDAVAMTGGQAHRRPTSPCRMIAQQMRAEGVERIAVVSDEPDKYAADAGFPARRHVPSPRRHPGRADASSCEDQGVTGADLRPDLRGREAPPAQARRVSRSQPARLHQRARVRGLRRLRRQVELRRGPAGRDAIRPQAPDRPVGLQQGLFLPQGLLPELRHRRRRRAAQGHQSARLPGDGAVFPVLPEPALPALDRPWSILVTGIGGTGVVTIGHVLGMAAHLEGKGAAHHRHGRPVAEERRRRHPSQDRRSARRHRRDPHRRRRRRSHPRLRPRDRASERVLATAARARTQPWSTPMRPCRRSSPAIADFGCRPRRCACAIEAAHAQRRPRTSSMRPRSPRRSSAIPSPPICSRSALPGRWALIPLGAEVDRAGDRAQWRRGQDEHSRPSCGAGAPRMIRPRSRRSSAWPTTAPRQPQPRRSTRLIARRVDVPHRLSERRLCPPLRATSSTRSCAAEAAIDPRIDGAHRSGGALSLQADGLQGRV